jgi:tetratricopeptide (TPR) repeat protein
MKIRWLATLVSASLLVGIGIGVAGSKGALGIDAIRGKPAKEAGLTALSEAERLAGKDTWELIAVGRVYYLSGDKPRGQALFDRVINAKPAGSDWARVGQVYAEAGENDRAEGCFQKMLALDAKDDTGQTKVGAWYIRIGQRDKGEALLAQAFQRNPDEVWHYVDAAEALLGVPAGR